MEEEESAQVVVLSHHRGLRSGILHEYQGKPVSKRKALLVGIRHSWGSD